MFEISKRMILSRKKWLFTIVVSLSIMLSGLFATLFASEAIKANLRETAYEKYGEHTGVLFNTSVKGKQLSQKVDRYGSFSVTDKIQLESGKIITTGWFDREAQLLGRLKIVEGKFPIAKNEVVIEDAYKKLIEKESNKKWKIGEERILNFAKGSRKVVLSGVLKNYSSNWSVPLQLKKGENDFPNILGTPVNLNKKSYLFKFDGSINTSLENSNELTEKYGVDSFLNSRLFFVGLAEYDTISQLTFAFQVIIALLSFISIFTLMTFYNIKSRKKIAVFKSVGATNKQINFILNLKNMMLLCGGILLAIPCSILFAYIIIVNTYSDGTLLNLNWITILGTLFLLTLITFLSLILSVNLEIKTIRSYSINAVLKGSNKKTKKIKANTFWLKQLFVQIMNYKKVTLLTTATLTFTVLTILMSIFLQYESKGIWNTDTDYYIASQESYAFDTISNLTVLKEKGITFSEKDVDSLERFSSVKSLSKTPFMPDVHMIVDSEKTIDPIEKWIDFEKAQDQNYEGSTIVPNVEYQVLNEKDFDKKFLNDSFSKFKGQIIIALPTVKKEETEFSQKDINFVKMYSVGTSTKVKKWSYPLYKVIPTNSEESDNVFVYLDEETAKKTGIFEGYRELSLALKEDTTTIEKNKIEKVMKNLVSMTPGSLYQDINYTKNNEAKISDYVGFLGKFSFFIAVTLGMISLLTLIFGKYNSQKLYWGTYMAIGMTRKKVTRFLALELTSYFVVASLSSGLLFMLFATVMDRKYTLFFYFIVYIQVIFFMLLLLFIGIYLLKKLTEKYTIYSLLREEE